MNPGRLRPPTLILCGGLQSSGSTLVSWCFLQRADTDGVLDGDSDCIPVPPQGIQAPYVWYKAAISGFRLSESLDCLEDDGWQVKPLLVLRDVRYVWSSLSVKQYGINGTTAEDPPLRTRMRRFRADWQLFQRRGWPVIQFETFVIEPEATLRHACDQLGLPFDQGMLTWPKSAEQIADTRHGNRTFRSSLAGGLRRSLHPQSLYKLKGPIPADDLAWLEKAFAAFNHECGYPQHLVSEENTVAGRAVPSFEATRRHKWLLRQKPLKSLCYKLGFKSLAKVRN
jgi:hypothetical protein